MKTRLVTMDGTEHDYDAPDDVIDSGAIVSVFNYGATVRVFRFTQTNAYSAVPRFEEVKHTFVDVSTLPR